MIEKVMIEDLNEKVETNRLHSRKMGCFFSSGNTPADKSENARTKYMNYAL